MNSARLKARAKQRRAYFQGGGGVNEPELGKEKYPKEDADSIRDKEDKQMVGDPLETGKDGLHPGDEEIKKKLLRAEELKERKLRRRGYWQGGGGLNEPELGKEKYPKEDADSIRDKEDKQMVGEPLDTGRDGLHPGDEEIKKKLLRAKLNAKFTKVADKSTGKINKDASRWDFYAGDKLILTASGKEVWEDKLGEQWDSFSSKVYGKEVMRMIREDGFNRVAYLLKGADEMPGADLGLGGEAPAEQAPVVETPVPEEKPVEVTEEKNELQTKVDSALANMESAIDKVREAISEGGSEGDLVDIDVNVEPKDQPEKPGAVTEEPLEGLLSASRDHMIKVEALMNMCADELAEASETVSSLDKIAEEKHGEIFKAVKAAVSDSEAIMAEASVIIAKKDDDKDDKKDDDKKDDDKGDKKDCKKCKCDPCECDDEDDKEKKAQKLLDDAIRVRAENRAKLLSMAECYHAEDEQCAECGEEYAVDAEDLEGAAEIVKALEGQSAKDKDEDEKDDKKDKDDDKEDEEVSEDVDEDDEEEQDLMMMLDDPSITLEARKSERESIVAKAGDILNKYELDLGKATNATEPTFFQAHPGGKGTVTELTHTKTPEAKVETISEVHDIMRDVAESGPRNVRDAAEVIQDQIVKGAFKAEDLEQLVAEGKVDASAAAYWKKYFGLAADSGDFGSQMSAEFTSQKKKASDENYRVKVRRAYDIAIEAQEKGLIRNSRESLEKYVDELVSFEDAAFESTKRVVSSYSPSKSSGSVPRVGLDAATEAMEVTASVEPEPIHNIRDTLSALGWK